MAQSFIAELVVSHSDLPLTPTIQALSDSTILVESQPLSYPEQFRPLIFFSVSDVDFSEFESALATDHTVEKWEVTIEFTECRIYQIYLTPDAKFTTPKIAALGLQVLSIRSTDGGWHFRLQAPDKECLGEYWEYCREEDVQFHLEKLYSTGPQASAVADDSLEAALTDRQREVARTAARMGYFEPDGADAATVADELDISPSTLSTHLRRIMAKVLRHTFDD